MDAEPAGPEIGGGDGLCDGDRPMAKSRYKAQKALMRWVVLDLQQEPMQQEVASFPTLTLGVRRAQGSAQAAADWLNFEEERIRKIDRSIGVQR